MTETEWRTSADPEAMVKFLLGRAGERKLRLFAAACVRRVWHLPLADAVRAAVEVAERYADGEADVKELAKANQLTSLATSRRGRDAGALEAARFAARLVTYHNVGNHDPRADWEKQTPPDPAEVAAQCDLLRCIFADPFDPVAVDPDWLARNEGRVAKVAESIYRRRAFDELPLLADALEDCGCADTRLLDHCRGAGPHARGCFAVDALTGRK